jgi:hypothetical protein
VKKPRMASAVMSRISGIATKVRNSVDVLLEPHVPENPGVVREYDWPDTPPPPPAPNTGKNR